MRQNKAYLTLMAMMLLLVSCSPKTAEVLEKLPRVKDSELAFSLDSMANQHFGSFYAKLSTNYEDSSQNVNFKTSIRIKEDSLVNALITYARIPIFNTLITTDSIKLTDKREKCYQMQSLDFMKENFGVDFSYRNIEELFFGMPIAYDSTSKYFRVKDPYTYTVCSHRKKQVNRLERRDEDVVILYYVLSADRRDLLSTIVESPQDTTSIQIDYVKRMDVNGYRIPKDVKVQVKTPRKLINIRMEYDKAEVGIEEEIYFVIPEGYEECSN